MSGPRTSSDPTDIRSLAVTTSDLVTALEANQRSSQTAVLRVTPPFYGRMRARIHLAGGEASDYGEPSPLHLSPESFLAETAPHYPETHETRPEPYDVETHHERHTTAVSEWRTAVRDHLRDRISIPTASGAHEVEVKYLG
ncbi:hypothetical protein C455_04851 [Haloferax larsenii JCM 13917]|nr:hypothetical protein [Haloferax larsenii]ELZ81493.1 hypothetical protein C455_04851 [Haloferax larsenii JCM 13917]